MKLEAKLQLEATKRFGSSNIEPSTMLKLLLKEFGTTKTAKKLVTSAENVRWHARKWDIELRTYVAFEDGLRKLNTSTAKFFMANRFKKYGEMADMLGCAESTVARHYRQYLKELEIGGKNNVKKEKRRRKERSDKGQSRKKGKSKNEIKTESKRRSSTKGY